jgi:hypothetical protein
MIFNMSTSYFSQKKISLFWRLFNDKIDLKVKVVYNSVGQILETALDPCLDICWVFHETQRFLEGFERTRTNVTNKIKESANTGTYIGGLVVWEHGTGDLFIYFLNLFLKMEIFHIFGVFNHLILFYFENFEKFSRFHLKFQNVAKKYRRMLKIFFIQKTLLSNLAIWSYRWLALRLRTKSPNSQAQKEQNPDRPTSPQTIL